MDSSSLHLTPHARSYSIDSVSTTASHPLSDSMPSPTFSAFRSPLPSPGLLLDTPDLLNGQGFEPSALYSEAILLDSPQVPAAHMRNASYSVGTQPRSLGATLSANKSLPDLRLGFQESARARKPNLPDLPAVAPQNNTGLSPSPNAHSPGIPLPVQRINGPSMSAGSSPRVNGQSTDGQVASVDPERNAYFRRFSIQRPPPSDRSGPSSGPSVVLLAVVDAARGIFFALSQLYEALRQFTVSITHDGLSGVLMKVLHPARKFLAQLIDSLDRFDEQSKQPSPSPAVCRGVVQACKDSVSMFNKVIGVLSMQLNLVTASHDPRYTRWLLLILHGSMTEVSVSWQVIVEHGEAIQPLLNSSRLKSHAPSRSLVSPITKSADTLQSPASAGSSNTNGSYPSWARGSRRQGGSYSAQLGRALPGADAPPGTPPPLRRAQQSNGGRTPPLHGLPTPSSADAQHAPDDSVTSQTRPEHDPVFNGYHTPQPSVAPQTRHNPTTSASAVDHDLFATMGQTVDVAGGVWGTLADIVAESDHLHSLVAALDDAQEVTRRLRGDMEAFRIGSTPAVRKAIWEDANSFIKVRLVSRCDCQVDPPLHRPSSKCYLKFAAFPGPMAHIHCRCTRARPSLRSAS